LRALILKQQRPKKGGTAPPTQATSAQTPTTSEPPTPTTPQHPLSFNAASNGRNFTSGGPNPSGGAPGAGQSVQQPTPNPTPAAGAVPSEIQPPSAFTNMDIGVDFTNDFGGNEADLLDNFDFDSFLNTTEDNTSLGFGGDPLQWTENEVGAGES
jgi:hypothetical protein